MQDLEISSSQSMTEQTRKLVAEVYKAFGLSPQAWYHRLLDPIFHVPGYRLTRIATNFDEMIQAYGLPEAARRVLPNFITGLKIRGADTIPQEGPLLLVANHPGAADTLCHVACIQREDLKIIASDIPYLRGISSLAKYLIPVTADPYVRMSAVHKGVNHIRNGGALLIFGSGKIDPDLSIHPPSQAREDISKWSGSLEVFLKHSPKIQVVLAIASGVMARSCWYSPLKYLKKTPIERRRIAEFIQVMLQLGLGFKFNLQTHISYSREFGLESFAKDKLLKDKLLEEIKNRARHLLVEHQALLKEGTTGGFQPVMIEA